jgi:hypothetical protein
MEPEIKFKLAPKPITVEGAVASIEQMATALANARANVQEMLAPFEDSFNQAAAVVRAFADFHDKLRQSVRQWLIENQEGLSRMAQLMAAALAEFEQYRNEEEAEACALLSQAGWLRMDHHFSMPELRESVLLHKTQGESAINDAILGYFNRDNSASLDEMSKGWLTIPYLRDRENIVRDAVYAHKSRMFTLSIPALLPLVDGLSAEILGIPTMKAVPLLAEDWRTNPEVWVQGFCDFVAQVYYKGYVFGKDTPPYLTRHGILHGRVFDYPSALNSTRVFLLIDAVAELWHEKQKALAPTMIN